MLETNKNKGPRACATCAKAKSRCVPSPVPNICERCHRLNKPCGSQTPAPPRRRRTDMGGAVGGGAAAPGSGLTGPAGALGQSQPKHKTGTKPTRVAELERRLEDLTSRLDSVSRQQQQNLPAYPENDDPQHRTTPLDIFRAKAHWGYMYPARHIFPSEDQTAHVREVQAAKDTVPNATAAAPASTAGGSAVAAAAPRHTSVSSAISPSATVASPASNNSGSNNSTSGHTNSASEVSSTSTAPMSGADMKTDDFAACAYFPPFPFTRERPSQGPQASRSSGSGRDGDAAPQATTQPRGPSALRLPANPASFTPSFDACLWPTAGEAEMLLSEYRRYVMPIAPFIIVPEHVSAEQLRAARPYLWKSIIMVACHLDGSRQIQMGNQLLGEIAAAAFLQPHRSIDLLQSVLLIIAWYHYNINSFQLTNYVFLARAMCVSLCYGDTPAPSSQQPAEHSSETLEKMRAVMGTYYLVTLATTTGKKADMMMSNDYLENCCQVLERQHEYPTDAYLVQLVKVQQLGQSISAAFQLRSSGMQLGLPSAMQMVQNLKQQLDAYKAQIPEAFRKDGSLRGHLCICEILLYEVGLENGSSPSGNLPGQESFSNADRLDLLYACMRATQGFLNNRFAEPIADQPRFLCLTSYDFMFTFLTALKLMTIQTPGWSRRRARKELEFDDLVDRQIRDMQMLAERRSMRGHGFGGRGLTKLAVRGGGGGPDGGGGNNNDNENNNSSKNTNGASGPRRQDPFERLAQRLLELKTMIARELDRLPANEDEDMLDGATAAATTTTVGAAPSTAAADTPTPFTAALLASSSSGGPFDAANAVAAEPEQPVLNFTDATIDYMQQLDLASWPDLLTGPGWEPYLDVDMATPPLFDTWNSSIM